MPKKMARKSRRRYYRKKGRWSANIQQIFSNDLALSPGDFYFSATLATNPAQSNSTVSQQFTAKNFELSFSLDIGGNINPALGSLIERVIFYIMYVPQGYTINGNLPINHPEWIMSYKFMGSIDMETEGNADNIQYVGPKRGPYRIRTRLSRRLQTGDSIVLLICGNNGYNQLLTAELAGLLRWWTKAN